eukprot:2561136-Rhodomonas_salina.1
MTDLRSACSRVISARSSSLRARDASWAWGHVRRVSVRRSEAERKRGREARERGGERERRG